MSLHNFQLLHLRSYFQNSSSCFIVVSKHLATIKALGLRPRAFICFSVFGYPDETLALVLEIVQANEKTRFRLEKENHFNFIYGFPSFFFFVQGKRDLATGSIASVREYEKKIHFFF